MNCPNCESSNLQSTGAENVRHKVQDGAVVHVISDSVHCLACDSVFDIEREAVEPPPPPVADLPVGSTTGDNPTVSAVLTADGNEQPAADAPAVEGAPQP